MELLRILAAEGNSFWTQEGFNLMMMSILFVIFLCLIGVVAIFWMISKGVDCVFKGCETNDEEALDQNEIVEEPTDNEE